MEKERNEGTVSHGYTHKTDLRDRADPRNWGAHKMVTSTATKV